MVDTNRPAPSATVVPVRIYADVAPDSWGAQVAQGATAPPAAPPKPVPEGET